MSATLRLREKEAELKAARDLQRELLAEWRQTHSPTVVTRLAFATDAAERLADEFEVLQTEAFAEYYRLQKELGASA